MVSTYHGIETGRRALEYFKKGMEIAGINTSNTAKAGYSRQVVSNKATDGLSTAVNISHLGTGVKITAIERMRDLFLDSQLRRATTEQAYWETMSTGVLRIEKFIVNTNAKGLNNLLDSFWAGIQQVQKFPSDSAVRNAALQEADTLAKFTNDLYSVYGAYRDELNKDVKALVTDANSYIDQIAILNKAIKTVRVAGGEPNSLLDQRDLLAEKLSTLTGASVGPISEEMDSDYKISINGKVIVQGTNTKHLMLVENPANKGYYDVQIEYDQYDITSDYDVAGVIIESRANDLREVEKAISMNGGHELSVYRTADEFYWTVGYALGQSQGGERKDDIIDSNEAVGLSGSFALQVGSRGVRAYSQVFDSNPPGLGNVLGEPGPGERTSYTFRIAAGDFERTITADWDDGLSRWVLSSNNASDPSFTAASQELSVSELSGYINGISGGAVTASVLNNSIIIEAQDGQILSIDDTAGDLMERSGLANANPIVLIEVDVEDSLQTIANKINNAYLYDRAEVIEVAEGDEFAGSYIPYTTVPPNTAPSSPEQWMHATVEQDADGNYFLALTSNVVGEANRINVLSGEVCGASINNMHVARVLGLIEDGYDDADLDPQTGLPATTTDPVTGLPTITGSAAQTNLTSYIQLDRANNAVVTRYTEGGDIYVDDAYIEMDGRKYLSSSNSFKYAREIYPNGESGADELVEFYPGLRIFLNGKEGASTNIIIRHHLTDGAIYASLKLRDDVLLSQMDTFDEMMYQLATQFNAVHYSGYGNEESEYSNVTGMAFFETIKNQYGAFGNLAIDSQVMLDQNRFAAACGGGTGASLGSKDGTNALSLAKLKQATLFMGGMADFEDLYKDFVAGLGAFGQLAANTLQTQDYVIEQIEVQREAVMGVNTSEEMLSIVEFNQSFNYASQYISTMFQVIDQIITGVGRVGL
ncbi:MAG: flagellar hook-associated protein FlgK [Synergistaceae bacterium]|nr:flagellar hook-associated protein FlgK [Synergistaceae bacterium]